MSSVAMHLKKQKKPHQLVSFPHVTSNRPDEEMFFTKVTNVRLLKREKAYDRVSAYTPYPSVTSS